MKFVITLFFVACGFQVYSAKPTVFMFPDQGNHLKTIDALGAQVKSVLRPAYFKGVDDLRRTRDELEEALSNFNDAFGDTIFTIDIFTMDDLCVFGDIMEGVRNLFSGPLNTFLDTIETFLLEATNKTKQTIGKTDAQLATILNAVIVNAVKCMANLDVTATLEVKNKTGIVKLAVQKVKYTLISSFSPA